MKPRFTIAPDAETTAPAPLDPETKRRLMELLQQQEAAPQPGAAPSGNTYGSLSAGLTQLGEGIANRMAMMRQNRLESQIRDIDPKGDIVRELMRGGR